jgi:hypothetical protein
MKEQALKLAKEFDELAEIGFETVLRSENESPLGKQLTQYHISFAKDHQRNAQLLRDLVVALEIKELSDEEIKAIELQISEGVACYDDFDFVAFARAILKKASEK